MTETATRDTIDVLKGLNAAGLAARMNHMLAMSKGEALVSIPRALAYHVRDALTVVAVYTGDTNG
jgi:hypothetical protein